MNEPQAFGKDFDSHFGKGGSKLLNMKASDFNEITTSLLTKMNKTHKEPANLKECSPWMSEFRAEFLRNELEVPGKFPFSGDVGNVSSKKAAASDSAAYVGCVALRSRLTQRYSEITVTQSLKSVLPIKKKKNYPKSHL